MATDDDKKFDNLELAGSSGATVTPVYADEERGYDEKNGMGYEGPAGGDRVVVGGLDPTAKEGAVQRNLKGRHLAMIALGGTIGTGLFVGSGDALAKAGPVGVWLGYSIMGAVVWTMMIALGEMGAFLPVSGGFTHYATRFIDPAFGFALGYNYWYSYAITIPTELVASAIIISYWNETINAGVWIAILLVAIWVVNLFGVALYGEFEFWFSLIKILAIVGLIILGIILDAGGGPNKDPIGFRYWRNPGPFNSITINNGADHIDSDWGKFLAFWNVFVQAAFSYVGTEIIAVTFGEAQNPRKEVPKAIKKVFFRILIFYVLGIWVISVLVPYNSPKLLGNSGAGDASASPFVIAMENAGIHALPSIINAVLLIAAWSAGNSDLYAASRTLYALALEDKAPAFIKKCTKSGVPLPATIITGVFGLLGFMCVTDGTSTVIFNWLYAISSITGLIAWSVILGAYLRFYQGLKYHGIDRNTLPYKAPFQPYASIIGFIFVNLVILFNGFTFFLAGNWDTSGFISAYVSLPIFVAFYAFWKIYKRTKWVKISEMDFVTGRKELDEMDMEQKELYGGPLTIWGKIGDWLF